jgi:hypothetical protein
VASSRVTVRHRERLVDVVNPPPIADPRARILVRFPPPTIDRLSVRPLARRRRTASDSRIPVLVLADFGVEKKFSLEGLDAKAVEKEVTGVLKQSA